MNDVITIENTEMQIREYDGERVVTFKDIDTVHQRPAGTARKAFYRNKKRFEENKHYISLKPKENPNVRLTDNRNISIPNKGRMYRLCRDSGNSRSYLYHCILNKLSERYDLNAAREIYKNEVGNYPEYPIDIVKYFPELEQDADKILDSIERMTYR